MQRIARTVTRSLFGLVVAAGCGDEYSSEDAKTFCDQERAAKQTSGCVTDAAYAQCVDCYERCGGDCRIAAKCPEVYECTGE